MLHLDILEYAEQLKDIYGWGAMKTSDFKLKLKSKIWEK